MRQQHADILDEQESLQGAFFGAIGLHVFVVAAITLYGWTASHSDFFGAQNAGGSIGIEAVSSIPLLHHGPQNPVAHDTQSEVPQQVPKPVEQVKKEKPPPPDAVPLKSRQAKKREAEAASTRQRFRPFSELDQNQVTSRQAPSVSNPMYSAPSGSGRVGAGPNTTLGNRFPAYAQQIQQLVAQKWRTADVDARIQTAPTVIATFDLMRDGSIRNVQILQRSGIPSLDFSVQRAILEASPFPPIPPGFDRDYAKVEFWFELKR
jgi:protein TonB